MLFLESVLERRQKGGRFGGRNGETASDSGLLGMWEGRKGAFGGPHVCGRWRNFCKLWANSAHLARFCVAIGARSNLQVDDFWVVHLEAKEEPAQLEDGAFMGAMIIRLDEWPIFIL